MDNLNKPKTPSEADQKRTGDANFPAVVLYAGIALALIMIAAVIFLHFRGKKVVPKIPDNHPTSLLQRYPFPEPSASHA